MSRRIANEKRRRFGQTLVEFCLVMPLLVLVLVALVHFGIVIWTFVQVNAANREGALYGSYHPHDDPGMITMVKACLPSWINRDESVLSITVTGETTRPPGSRIFVKTVYNIAAAGGVLPGGSLMPTPGEVKAEASMPVLVGTK